MNEQQDAIAFIGLGRMGTPMAQRLLDSGFTVRGFDPTPAAGQDLQGGTWSRAASAAEAATGASVVVLMLPNSDVVDAVVADLRSASLPAPGSTILDMSSSDPVRTRALVDQLDDPAERFGDAPVSGGGTGEDLEKVRPVLAAVGERIVLVGSVGAGHAAKALNNLMSAAHLLASSEAMLAARAFGLDVTEVLEAVNGSSGRSVSTELKWPKFIVPETYDSGFAMQLLVKDVRIARRLGEAVGQPMRFADRALEMWDAALSDLGEGADHTEIARWVAP
jgi:3-hydroxyisobutyrate dehydrogenase